MENKRIINGKWGDWNGFPVSAKDDRAFANARIYGGLLIYSLNNDLTDRSIMSATNDMYKAGGMEFSKLDDRIFFMTPYFNVKVKIPVSADRSSAGAMSIDELMIPLFLRAPRFAIREYGRISKKVLSKTGVLLPPAEELFSKNRIRNYFMHNSHWFANGMCAFEFDNTFGMDRKIWFGSNN